MALVGALRLVHWPVWQHEPPQHTNPPPPQQIPNWPHGACPGGQVAALAARGHILTIAAAASAPPIVVNALRRDGIVASVRATSSNSSPIPQLLPGARRRPHFCEANDRFAPHRYVAHDDTLFVNQVADRRCEDSVRSRHLPPFLQNQREGELELLGLTPVFPRVAPPDHQDTQRALPPQPRQVRGHCVARFAVRVCKHQQYPSAAIAFEADSRSANVGEVEQGCKCARAETVSLDSALTERALARQWSACVGLGRR